jgi:hypothetical protein
MSGPASARPHKLRADSYRKALDSRKRRLQSAALREGGVRMRPEQERDFAWPCSHSSIACAIVMTLDLAAQRDTSGRT